MAYICLECGCVFDEPKKVEENHGITDGGLYEIDRVCPKCGGGFDELHECCECGKQLMEDECFEGYCAECLAKEVNYDTAFRYLRHSGCIVDFMIGAWYGSDYNVRVTAKLAAAMGENFRREVANEKLLGTTDFLTAIKEYILEYDSWFGKQDFAEWLTREGKR